MNKTIMNKTRILLLCATTITVTALSAETNEVARTIEGTQVDVDADSLFKDDERSMSERMRTILQSGDEAGMEELLRECVENGVSVIDLVRKLAEQGDADSQNTLGVAYNTGIGVEKDDSKEL